MASLSFNRRRDNGWMRRAIPLSVFVHALIAVAIMLWTMGTRSVPAIEKPDVAAQVQLLLGQGGEQSGGPPPGTPTPDKAEKPEAPPPSPQAPPAEPKPVVPQPPAPPSPPPEPQSTAPASPPPSAAPQPKPAPEVPPAPPAPPSEPAKPSGAPVAQAAPPAPAAVRLGDGGTPPPAEIDSPYGYVTAGPDAKNYAPEYPIEAARRHEEGTVVLAMHIDETGAVTDIDILQSSGSSRLDGAAKKQLLTWHFRPAIRNGQAVSSVVEQSIDFKF